MNIEDAIRIIKGLDTSNSEENIEAKKIAVAAMKKQIPKRPVTYTPTNRADCPVCGETVRGIDNLLYWLVYMLQASSESVS